MNSTHTIAPINSPAKPIYYTTLQYEQGQDDLGNSLRLQDDDKTFAKALLTGLSSQASQIVPIYLKYYIRFDNQEPHNPFYLYSVDNDRGSFKDRVCKIGTTYRSVTKQLFDMYTNYLRTENSQWYKKVQKEAKNL